MLCKRHRDLKLLLGTSQWSGNVVKVSAGVEHVTDVVEYELIVDEKLNITGTGKIRHPDAVEKNEKNFLGSDVKVISGLAWEKAHPPIEFSVPEGVVRVRVEAEVDEHGEEVMEPEPQIELLFIEEFSVRPGGKKGRS